MKRFSAGSALIGIALSVMALMGQVSPANAQEFSPDGKQAVFPVSGALNLANLDAASVQPLPGGSGGAFARWSPDGAHILFVTDASPTSEARLYNVSSGKMRAVGGNWNGPLAWREDGKLFACLHSLGNGRVELINYNVGERGISLKVPVPFSATPNAPMVWLPGTDNVALLGADGNVYTVESGETHKITTTRDVIGLSLFDRGKKLIWARRSLNLRYILMTLYAFDLNARNVVRLPFPERVSALNPDARHAPISIDAVEFSPDGANIALICTFAGSGKGGNTAVYSVSIDGKRANPAFRAPVVVATSKAAEFSMAPASITVGWSKDSKTLGILYRQPQRYDLLTSLADGTGQRTLFTGSRP